MANLKGLASIVSELTVVRTNLANQLKHVDAALAVLGKLGGGRSYAKPGHTVSASARKRMSLAQKARWAKAKGHAPKPKRTISAAGRRKIAAAQRARWASVRKQSQSVLAGKTTSFAPAKRTMSASARRKIAAAQRARWTKIRAANRKAA